MTLNFQFFLNLKEMREKREKMLNVLENLIEEAQRKLESDKISVKDKTSWGRLLVSAISTYGKLLEYHEIQDLENEVSQLEAFVKRMTMGE